MVGRHRYLTPLIAFLVGLAATAATAWLVAGSESGRRDARFDGHVANAVNAVESRMLALLTLLRGTAGFYNATEGVSREDFREYVARLRLEHNYPGVLGIGFAAYAPGPDALDATVARARAEGQPEFQAWPAGEREDYSAILHLEPMNRRNAAAIGYDMMSEPTRRAAMLAAREAGLARTSGRVRLVQEIDPVKQPGFLVYLPLYRGDRDGISNPLDPGSLYGWVYSPLRAYDLFDAAFRHHDLSSIVVEIYDGEISAESLLYSSADPLPQPDHVAVRRIDSAGRPWLVRVSSLPEFERGSPQVLAALVALAGTLISLLIAVLMAQQLRSAVRTEREVELRTAELREANEMLVAEADAREEAEARMRQMQKIESIGQLTGGIAHDFNNMLAVIIGNLDMAERRSNEPDRMRRAIASAKAGALRAAELTQRLLAFGRQQALLPVPLELNELVEGMTDLLRRTLGETVQLGTDLSDELWMVHADRGQLENAILNLAINARDAMPDGGALTIETENRCIDSDEARAIGVSHAGEHVRLAIRDTGAGMSEEVAARALEPFFTTKEVGRGTGLGLSQVYGFVRQSGGHLRILSKPGEGTAVEIYLPRFHGDHRAATRDSHDEAPLPRGRKTELILVVEDEEQVRELSASTLRDLGYRVIEAANGAEALKEIDSHPEITLLFTDMVMPEMSGRRLVEAARERRPDLRVVFTTGYSPDVLGDQPIGAARTEPLYKPFTVAQLAQRIRKELDR